MQTKLLEEDVLAEARRLILEEDVPCVFVREGAVLRPGEGTGVRPLVRALDEEPELLRGSVVVDKIVGKAAAMLAGHEVYLSSPLATIKTLFSLFGEEEFFASVGLTLLRILCGFICGMIARDTGRWSQQRDSRIQRRAQKEQKEQPDAGRYEEFRKIIERRKANGQDDI